MTSDAKVGLLLGLAFIFLIAFIINGLPGFHGDRGNNELTINGSSSSLGLADGQRRASEAFNRTELVKKQPYKAHIPPMADDVRFEIPLPESSSVEKETNKTIGIKSPVHVELSSPAVAKKTEDEKTDSAKPASPKVYVVCEGDNLAAIAKKFYGPQEGNKRINVDRIFEANRKLLKSPHEIYVGQKLIIPPLPASRADENKKIEGVFPSTTFERIKSIGRRHPLSDDSRVKQSREYVVQEDDNLWRIAAEQLGDGSRYTEIAKLNADILDDEDTLSIGMRLKMPAR